MILGAEPIDHESSTRQLVESAIRALDSSKARSQQTELGVSPLGGCKKRVWLQLQGVVGENVVEPLPSMIGTAFHAAMEDAIRLVDPDGERFLIEYEVHDTKDRGIGKGHIDLTDLKLGKITDWKSTSKRNLRYFPKLNQRWQVQVYGLLMREAGFDIRTVELVAVPRDGVLKDIRVHTEPFNQSLAEDAFAWLRDVQDSSVEPAPGYSGKMCTDYCPFYHPTTCLGG